jgi:hypothetical protein
MKALAEILLENEDWLMQRVLGYAKDLGFTKYTSTLEEAWRLSISGLTASLCAAAKIFDQPPELAPDDDYQHDPLAQFGLVEARRHRQRGLTLAMFLGLMKYYRQSYVDLVVEKPGSAATAASDRRFVERCFDRIEVAFCQAWANLDPGRATDELQTANRLMTNEKNTYLTVFESLADGVLLLDREDKLVNLNHAASLLVDPSHVPGGHYYQAHQRDDARATTPPRLDQVCIGQPVAEVFPWLAPIVGALRERHETTSECRTVIRNDILYLEVRLLDILDVSEKLVSAIVVLRDVSQRTLVQAELTNTITELGRALSEVKTLSRLLPLCASCKKVRDDRGYWRQVEQYITEQTGALVSHAICPDCVRKLYPDLADEILAAGDSEADKPR